ncbi:cytochrome P450 [Millisia brevis]|uniref:cytochrome P450 n=1 Tax=Millisia brevis TaxID=264148 RepID=UPI000836C4A0|nr:cytochrome P450 [Millisia brevis]
MVAEVDEVVGAEQVGPRHLTRLPYVTAVFHEAMRLYPPVWALTRQATADTTLGGYRIRTGDYVVISPYLVHRHPKHWPHPEVFSPERFLGKPDYAPSAYIPFGAGQRRCIGAGFTVMEARIVLATILQRYRLELVRGGVVKPKPVMSLRPPGPIRMTVRPRIRSADRVPTA